MVRANASCQSQLEFVGLGKSLSTDISWVERCGDDNISLWQIFVEITVSALLGICKYYQSFETSDEACYGSMPAQDGSRSVGQRRVLLTGNNKLVTLTFQPFAQSKFILDTSCGIAAAE